MSTTLRPFLLKLSELISNIFNPLTSLLLFFIFYSSRHFTWNEAAKYFLPIFLIVVLPVVLWIFWNVRTGRYKDANVSDRKKRISLYLFLEFALTAYLAYKYFSEDNVDLKFLFLLLLLIALHISNYIVKSSMHTGINIFVAALFATENIWIGIGWIFLSVVVGITRIVLKRHTVQEVISGGLIAVFISFMYLYANIQFNH